VGWQRTRSIEHRAWGAGRRAKEKEKRGSWEAGRLEAGGMETEKIRRLEGERAKWQRAEGIEHRV
jgi:hypothetical protein